MLFRSEKVENAGTSASFGAILKTKLRVVHALMLREALGRYGHENLGFFWIVGEPLVFSGAIMILWSLVHLSHGGDVDVVPFALTGYSFITMWRHITGRSVGSLRQYNRFRYHRCISLFDIWLAMALLETVSCFAAFIVAYVPLWTLGACPTMSDPLILVAGYAMAAIFSLGFGLLLAGLSQTNEVIHHITPAVMYISIPLTGIFSMQSWLPTNVSRILLWSPLVNGIEMFRGGLFSSEVHAMYSVSYLAVTAALTLIVGLFVFDRALKNVEI